jgi:hypothetical protein
MIRFTSSDMWWGILFVGLLTYLVGTYHLTSFLNLLRQDKPPLPAALRVLIALFVITPILSFLNMGAVTIGVEVWGAVVILRWVVRAIVNRLSENNRL